MLAASAGGAAGGAPPSLQCRARSPTAEYPRRNQCQPTSAHYAASRVTLFPLPTAAHCDRSRHCLLLAVYLVQGLLGLSRLAVFTFLKDELGLAPATVALVTSSGYAPWVRGRVRRRIVWWTGVAGGLLHALPCLVFRVSLFLLNVLR